MAAKSINKYLGMGRHFSGKTVNVYDTYAHALTHGATGLATISAMNNLDGTAGSSISQVAKTTGVVVDENGFVQFNTDNSAGVYLKIEGSFVPVFVATAEMF